MKLNPNSYIEYRPADPAPRRPRSVIVLAWALLFTIAALAVTFLGLIFRLWPR